ncbi:MAG: hypothetical protein ACR2J9_03460 [Gaiellales bacterium]
MKRLIGLLIGIVVLVLPAQALAAETVTFGSVTPERYTSSFTFTWTISGSPVINGAPSHPAKLTFHTGLNPANDRIVYLQNTAAIGGSLSLLGSSTAATLATMTDVAPPASNLLGTETLLYPGTWTATLEAFDSSNTQTAIGTSAPFAVYGLCEAGTYSVSGWAPGCFAARPGYHVYTGGATAEDPCDPGTYTANAGSMSCIDAEPGTYIDHPAATSGEACARGTYQPDYGQTRCVDAPPNSYVDAPGATAYTACPAGTTSPSASTSASACVAPAATPPALTSASEMTRSPACVVAKRGVVTAACVARQLGISIARPKRARLSLSTRTQAACHVERRRIRGTAAGSCQVVLVVAAPGTMAKSYRASITISA